MVDEVAEHAARLAVRPFFDERGHVAEIADAYGALLLEPTAVLRRDDGCVGRVQVVLLTQVDLKCRIVDVNHGERFVDFLEEVRPLFAYGDIGVARAAAHDRHDVRADFHA